MLRFKLTLLLLLAATSFLFSQEYLHCTVDVNESSSSKKLNFGVTKYQEPAKYRGQTVSSLYNSKTEIINNMAKEGWELEKIDNNILYFRIDTERPTKYLYCTVDVNESSSSKKLNFGVTKYQEPAKYRDQTVSSLYNSKTEIINKMAKEGWELEKIDNNILYFRIDTERPTKYLYCTVNVNEPSSSKKLNFGVTKYQEPAEYRDQTVSSLYNNKTEIINKMMKDGWEFSEKIQYGENLLFRTDAERPTKYLYCTVNVNESSSNKKLNFGVTKYQEPTKYRDQTVSSLNNSKTEIINKMAKEGWELEKIDNNILYFRIDTEQPTKYLYCTVDVNEPSSSKKLDFGVTKYQEPAKYRGQTVSSNSNNKTEIINKMAKEGWKVLKEIQFEDKLLFRRKLD